MSAIQWCSHQLDCGSYWLSQRLKKCLIRSLKTTVWLSLVFTAFGSFKPFLNVKNFRVLCVLLFSYQGSLLPSRESAWLSYQTAFCLSRTFLAFLNFFVSSWRLAWSSFVILPCLSPPVKNFFQVFLTFFWLINITNGEGGIWTLAPRKRPTPLAGAPLQPLEYFSNAWFI